MLKNVVELVWGIPAARPPAKGLRETRTFDVDVQNGSVLDVLTTAARVRGDMMWFITVAQRPPGSNRPRARSRERAERGSSRLRQLLRR